MAKKAIGCLHPEHENHATYCRECVVALKQERDALKADLARLSNEADYLQNERDALRKAAKVALPALEAHSRLTKRLHEGEAVIEEEEGVALLREALALGGKKDGAA